MGRMSLFSRSSDQPGTHGVLRDCTPHGKGFRRLAEGDIAVIDCPDISRRFAQRLIEANPAVVVNAAEFSTGAIPNFGPQMLLSAGVVLVEGVGSDVIHSFRDGKKGRVDEDGAVFVGDRHVADGTVVDLHHAETKFDEAQQSLVDHMEAYFGNAIQFIHSESPLLIDGLGIPDTGVSIEGRTVIVVSPMPDLVERLGRLKPFIREQQPLIIGVDDAADVLIQAGYDVDIIVGNPADIAAETLRSGTRVVLPAEPDGHAAGLERIQDLGIGAMTFPAATDSATDLAFLLAEFYGAKLIVNVGPSLNLETIFGDSPQSNPAALLVRAKMGGRLVDSEALITMYYGHSHSSGAWLWAVLGIITAIAAIVLLVGLGGDDTFLHNLINTWNTIALTFQSWFK
ncbi:putative cytokinetic ring protein SteA [Corynebacterium poyangense]|uniref:putative cytokinetic ring protein SteA n=1 Tax=Corynebacterium poyangense TaxID=2684405 RepID=UPI001CCD5F1F|nr:putative cytokinetic ring protein SteA [Corynebacterium poyangense]